MFYSGEYLYLVFFCCCCCLFVFFASLFPPPLLSQNHIRKCKWPAGDAFRVLLNSAIVLGLNGSVLQRQPVSEQSSTMDCQHTDLKWTWEEIIVVDGPTPDGLLWCQELTPHSPLYTTCVAAAGEQPQNLHTGQWGHRLCQHMEGLKMSCYWHLLSHECQEWAFYDRSQLYD